MPRRRYRRFRAEVEREGDLSHWEARSEFARQAERPRDLVRSQVSRVRLRSGPVLERRRAAVGMSLAGVLRARRPGVLGAIARARSGLESRGVVSRRRSWLDCVRQNLREMRERQGSGGGSPRRTKTRDELRRELFAAARNGC